MGSYRFEYYKEARNTGKIKIFEFQEISSLLGFVCFLDSRFPHKYQPSTSTMPS